MPDDAGSFRWCLPGAQSINDLQHGPVLLVAADDLGSGVTHIHKHRAVAHDVQQRLLRQHPLNEKLLLPFLPKWRLILAILHRVDVTPRIKVFLIRRCDRPELALIPTGPNDELIRVEQPRLTFLEARLFRLFTLFRIPHQLLEGFGHWIGFNLIPVLCLNNNQRHAVHEQHNVWNDEQLHAARCVDAELVDGVEGVSLRMLEVDQLDVWVFLAGQFVLVGLNPVE